MSRYVFDIEGNELLKKCTRMWVLRTKNLDTGEKQRFLEGDLNWKKVFDEATLVIGHNILGYDVPLLEKLFDYKFPKTCKMHDTLIMSRVLDYRRFGMRGHSLEVWGIVKGFKKIDWRLRAEELGLCKSTDPKGAEFWQWHPEMDKYCERDVDLNELIYIEDLLPEFMNLKVLNPFIVPYMQAEHAATKWQTRAEWLGWPFDKEGAIKLFNRLDEEKTKIHNILYDRLGMKAVIVDRIPKSNPPEAQFKEPRWTKDGAYHSHTANWFDVEPVCGYDQETIDELNEEFGGNLTSRPIDGPYCRVQFEHLELTSSNDVKLFLYRNGWEPSEWNYKFNPETKKKEKTSPKIVEDDLELLGDDGKLYSDFLTISSRYNNLRTWIENVDDEGNLHGDSIVIGTPSMRTRHQIIVNVPSGDSPWGKEMRQLFTHPPGWKLIGADSSGNQARGLAHYLGDEEFIDIILNKDVHIYNATKLIGVLDDMGIEHNFTPESFRPKAKRILYAFLFGASGGKLWSYIFGAQDKHKGNKLKKGFLKAVPGFSELIEKLENIYGSTSQSGYGYIPSIAGNRIYVDSFHKLLVYLLQAMEKATCAAALMLAVEKLEEEGIPYRPLIHYHDEIDYATPEEYAERAAEIGAWAFREGPKLFDVTIMDGNAKIGDNWYDIH